jgi:hypothetical protein
MFGWFRRRKLDDMWAAGVPAVFKSMKAECPGAAFLFARTIYNYQESKAALEKAAIIQQIENEMTWLRSVPSTGNKACYLGVRFVKACAISLRSHDELVRMLTSSAVSEITPFAETYRNLEPRDYQSPTSEIVRLSLEKRGRKCVADAIEAVVAEYEERGLLIHPGSPSCSEAVETLLANYDASSEWENGPCKNYFARLINIIPA